MGITSKDHNELVDNLTEGKMIFSEIYYKFKEYAMAIKKEQGEKREFNTGAKKQPASGKGTPVLVPGDAILDVAVHFEEGAAHYGPRNWEKGIPLSEILNSAERHLQQEKMGMTDESHDRAFTWNAIVYLATKLRIAAGILPQELDDIPKYPVIQKEDEFFKCRIIDGKFTNYGITHSDLGYYISAKIDNNYYYLHKDLKFHIGTGYTESGSPLYGEAPGYYPSKEIAKAYLRAYLDKTEDKHGYCDECYKAIKNAKDGEVIPICKKCGELVSSGKVKI